MPTISGKKILITGGAGFIGYHLARELSRDRVNRVDLVDNFVRGKKDDEVESLSTLPNVRLIAGDLTDPATFARLDTDYDDVYHLAAIIGVSNVIERPHEVVRVNAVATLFLLDWFTKSTCRKLLFSSTSEAYAWTQQFHPLPVPTPEEVPLALTDLANPRSSYAGSKIFGELAVHNYCRMFGKPFTIVRYHNVYGPRMGYEHVIPQLFERARGGQNPLVVYSADHRRAFCYVDDAIAMTIGAMCSPAADNQTINIGNDHEEHSIGELAQRLLIQAGIASAIEPRTAEHDPIVRRCPDITKARELLGYQPRITLDEGLAGTLAWYAQKFRTNEAP